MSERPVALATFSTQQTAVRMESANNAERRTGRFSRANIPPQKMPGAPARSTFDTLNSAGLGVNRQLWHVPTQ